MTPVGALRRSCKRCTISILPSHEHWNGNIRLTGVTSAKARVPPRTKTLGRKGSHLTKLKIQLFREVLDKCNYGIVERQIVR